MILYHQKGVKQMNSNFNSRLNIEIDSVIKRIYECIHNSGLSYAELSNRTGIAKSALHRYATGQTKKIPIDAVRLIADATGVSTSYIMGWEDNKSDYTNLPPPSITEDYTTFPVIGEVAAGYDHIAMEDWEGDTINIPNEYLKGRSKNEFFVLKVKGDSMYPTYQEGDRVLILKQSTLNYSGQVGVILYDDDYASLKKVEFKMGEDWLRMVPINPTHPIKKVEGEALEHCRILGIPKILIREVDE